jgi:hypothetical protein
MDEIRHHIKEEEGQMFAHMRQVIDAEDLRKLGARVQTFKKVAPTSPAQHGEDVACRVHEPIALTSQERGEGRLRPEAAARPEQSYADLTAIPGYATTSPDASYSSWDVNSAARAA